MPKSPVRPAFTRASLRAHEIIELMLRDMQRGLKKPELQKLPEWTQLFGGKHSSIENLQKLVQALAVLPLEAGTKAKVTAPEKDPELSVEEMEMLAAWLTQGSNGSL